MQFGRHRLGEHWRERHGIDRFVRDEATARCKLQAYWKQIGFERVGRSDVFIKGIAC
jgi:hypothetical protein